MSIQSADARVATALTLALAVAVAGPATVAPRLQCALVASAHAAPARPRKSNKPAEGFEYKVSDCLESDRQGSSKLVVSEGAVGFSNVLTMNCVAATRPGSVKVSYSKHGRDLEVRIVLRSPVLAECECPIEVDGTISKLEKGTYKLSFVYDFQPGESTRAKPSRQSLGTKEIIIN